MPCGRRETDVLFYAKIVGSVKKVSSCNGLVSERATIDRREGERAFVVRRQVTCSCETRDVDLLPVGWRLANGGSSLNGTYV